MAAKEGGSPEFQHLVGLVSLFGRGVAMVQSRHGLTKSTFGVTALDLCRDNIRPLLNVGGRIR